MVFSIGAAVQQSPLILEHFHHPQKKPISTHSIHSSSPQGTTNVLPVSTYLPVPDISHGWNHTLCGLLLTCSFHLQSRFWGWSMLWKCQSFNSCTSLYGETTICWSIQCLTTLSLFPLLAVMNSVPVNDKLVICMHWRSGFKYILSSDKKFTACQHTPYNWTSRPQCRVRDNPRTWRNMGRYRRRGCRPGSLHYKWRASNFNSINSWRH